MKTYQQIIHDLRQHYPEREARALARWLCEERFGLSQTDILLDKDNELSADDIANLQEITSRLIKHEPIQYILGYTTFCGHRFCVGPGALIPRPETASLVAAILRSLSAPSPSLRILDIGTGTGCIALSLSLALPKARVTAWDISPEALAIAAKNVESYPQAHVRLEQADILQPPASRRRWHVIVSNPPYVRQSEARLMDKNVLDYEPHQALFVPDDDPLLFYRAIARYAASHLTANGQLWFEINEALVAETAQLIEDFAFRDVQVLNDEYEKPRFVVATAPK